MSEELTQKRLQEFLHYEPTTGEFTRIKRSRGVTLNGEVAGSLHATRGYWRIRVRGKCYAAHRLAWLYVYGVWPTKEIDHINRIKTDNRIANLRELTTAENQQNVDIARNNTSGHKGVVFHKRYRKYQAYIRVNRHLKSLGSFETLEEAVEARKAAEQVWHPNAARAIETLVRKQVGWE